MAWDYDAALIQGFHLDSPDDRDRSEWTLESGPDSPTALLAIADQAQVKADDKWAAAGQAPREPPLPDPVADWIVTPDPPVGGQAATFDGSTSTPDPGISLYEWQFRGDATADAYGRTITAPPEFTAENPGVWAVSLTVHLPDGRTHRFSRPLEVALAPPDLTDAQPRSGPDTGGTTVTLTGTNLTGTTGVNFGATPGTDLVVDSASTVRITTPARAAGATSIVLQHPSGNVTRAGWFTFLAEGEEPPAE